jgi:hypothetical protein
VQIAGEITGTKSENGTITDSGGFRSALDPEVNGLLQSERRGGNAERF